jgi:hypothetical protein
MTDVAQLSIPPESGCMFSTFSCYLLGDCSCTYDEKSSLVASSQVVPLLLISKVQRRMACEEKPDLQANMRARTRFRLPARGRTVLANSMASTSC